MYRLTVLTIMVLICGGVPMAYAHDLGYSQTGLEYKWRSYHAIGYSGSYCSSYGLTNDRYVRSLKAILWGGKYILDMDNVNMTFSSGTNQNVRDYQRDHGLTVDGCVGPDTLTNIQDGRHWDPTVSVYRDHITTEGAGGYGAYRRWRDFKPYYLLDRWVRYYQYTSDYSGGNDERGCWHLLELVNQANGSSRTFGSHTRIDHDGDSVCD
jgi:hypothetical protein